MTDTAGRTRGEDVLPAIDWPEVWRSLAAAIRVHTDAGRRHLLTEDVVRFATVMVLADHGVPAARVAAERTIKGIGRICSSTNPMGQHSSSSSPGSRHS